MRRASLALLSLLWSAYAASAAPSSQVASSCWKRARIKVPGAELVGYGRGVSPEEAALKARADVASQIQTTVTSESAVADNGYKLWSTEKISATAKEILNGAETLERCGEAPEYEAVVRLDLEALRDALAARVREGCEALGSALKRQAGDADVGLWQLERTTAARLRADWELCRALRGCETDDPGPTLARWSAALAARPMQFRLVLRGSGAAESEGGVQRFLESDGTRLGGQLAGIGEVLAACARTTTAPKGDLQGMYFGTLTCELRWLVQGQLVRRETLKGAGVGWSEAAALARAAELRVVED